MSELRNLSQKLTDARDQAEVIAYAIKSLEVARIDLQRAGMDIPGSFTDLQNSLTMKMSAALKRLKTAEDEFYGE